MNKQHLVFSFLKHCIWELFELHQFHRILSTSDWFLSHLIVFHHFLFKLRFKRSSKKLNFSKIWTHAHHKVKKSMVHEKFRFPFWGYCIYCCNISNEGVLTYRLASFINSHTIADKNIAYYWISVRFELTHTTKSKSQWFMKSFGSHSEDIASIVVIFRTKVY